MKKPKKSELYRIISHLTSENQELKYTLEKEERKKWEEKTPVAVRLVKKIIIQHYGDVYKKLRLDHIDSAGYWFYFELPQTKDIQIYCVRHSDIGGYMI